MRCQIGINPLYSALIVGLAVSIYVTLGGLSAVIATDMIQFLCLSAFILVMAFLVMGSAGSTTNLSPGQLITAVLVFGRIDKLLNMLIFSDSVNLRETSVTPRDEPLAD